MAEADKSHPHPRPRFAFSFGFKLMAAMLLMVAAISTITLIVAQNRVDAVYREFLTGQFADQADLFFEKRDARLSGARTSIGDALSNVRLVAALGRAITTSSSATWPSRWRRFCSAMEPNRAHRVAVWPPVHSFGSSWLPGKCFGRRIPEPASLPGWTKTIWPKH